jgi:HK97 family phage portal protein
MPVQNMSAQLEAFPSVPVLFAIVDRLASTVASAEICLHRGETEVTSHPALNLLLRPNPVMSLDMLLETCQQHYELVGEAWILVSRSPSSPLPLELWPVRPDRMEPVPHPTKYVSGYVYRGPDGHDVPLGVDDVLFLRRPNPLDPYRGCGPVQSLMNHLNSSKYSAEWNANFFRNGAEPGGIIRVDRQLSDAEFDVMASRWREQHQGVSNAHRVAILEQAEWVSVQSSSQRDMQFAELLSLADETIRTAFGFPKPLLGSVDDVNRANAEAAEVVFARWLINPRLNRWARMFNSRLLPMFGTVGANVEFSFKDMSPDDAALKIQSRESNVGVLSTMIGLGFDVKETLEWLDLPEISFSKPEPPAPPVLPEPPPPPAPEKGADAWAKPLFRAAVEPPPGSPDGVRPELPPGAGPSLGGVQRQWESALGDLLDEWHVLSAQWREYIARAIEEIAGSGDILSLGNLTVDTSDGAAAIQAYMLRLFGLAASGIVGEANAQGITQISPASPDMVRTASVAQITSTMLGSILVTSAVGEAVRVWSPGVNATEVGGAVRVHLDSLTDAAPRLYLGSALTSAQHDGRLQTIASGPEAALYADETLDGNTCGPCRAIHRKWVGNASDGMRLKTYPTRGYVGCEGRDRCRGQVVAVWRGGRDWRKWVEMEPEK